MLPKNNPRSSAVAAAIHYTLPVISEATWMISFYAFDPVTGKMKRKRIRIPKADKLKERRRHAESIVYRLVTKLERGWNPWVEQEDSAAFIAFRDAAEKYRSYVIRQYNEGNMREKTMQDYTSKLRVIEDYNAHLERPITFIYQFDRYFIVKFLDYIYMDKGVGVVTRNNYLSFIGFFCSYLVQNCILKTKPCEGIQTLRNRNKDKKRAVIADNDMKCLRARLERENKNFMLACYILHYALIRPKEMSYIQLKHISLINQTLYIDGKVSKNWCSAVVTLPRKVLELMLDLNIFSYPSEYFLFGKDFKPGMKRTSERKFREYWMQLRDKMGWPDSYKFYSLKDTGITNMLHANIDTLSVRDQARHSSILMTNKYTPQDVKAANKILLNYDGVL